MEANILTPEIIDAIADRFLQKLSDAGMVLSSNEAIEYRKFQTMNEKLVSGTKAASMLSVSSSCITKMRATSKIRGVRVGSRWMYPMSEILKIKNRKI